MIGVVGPDPRAMELAEVLGVETEVGPAETVLAAGPDAAVAIGESAVSSLVSAGVDVPTLPVSAGPGLGSMTAARAVALIEDGLEDGFHTRERPVIAAAVDGSDRGRGVFDATLVTSEPAHISEFAVGTAGWSDRFRADGVVVSTPAGSHGYSRAVGGPLVEPGSASLVVVPVAAFAIRSTVRVADAEATIEVGVERDDGDVSLLVDGRECGRVPPRRSAEVRVSGSVTTVVDPEA